MLRVILVLLILAVPSGVLADDYSTQYGDGLRLYAEGRYDVALESLYRAYAVKPSPSLLRLILRSHDFMGHCSAVERQMALFKEIYPKEKAIEPQLCSNPGTLRIECSPHAGTVIIDNMITAVCGTAIRVPAGTHRVHNPQLNEFREFLVEPGKTTVATLQLNPEKWFPSRQNEIPLLKDPRHYTVIKSSDGLYEIWVRSDLRNDPDMNGVQVPGFTILKSTDGLYDISSDALKAPYTAPTDKPRERRKMPVVPITP